MKDTISPSASFNNEQFYSSGNPTANVDKRAIIKHQLETNFPTKTTVLFGLQLVIISLAEIGLQIGLIVNNGIHYEYGNGIWGGFFGIINSLLRLNMVRSHTYSAYVIYRNLRIFFHIAMDVGLLALTFPNLKDYKDCSTNQCTTANKVMAIIMFVLGFFATVTSIASSIVFDRLLFRNAQRVRLTIAEACSDWKYFCSSY